MVKCKYFGWRLRASCAASAPSRQLPARSHSSTPAKRRAAAATAAALVVIGAPPDLDTEGRDTAAGTSNDEGGSNNQPDFPANDEEVTAAAGAAEVEAVEALSCGRPVELSERLAGDLQAKPSYEQIIPEPERFYDDSYVTHLAAMIRSVVAEHGPLSQSLLFQRIARAHGFQRAGREIQTRIVAAIPASFVQSSEDVGVFVWPDGAAPDRWDVFRRPSGGLSRDPAEIPMAELVVLARQCLRSSADEEAALIAMRDGCGLQRLREASRERCRRAIAAARAV